MGRCLTILLKIRYAGRGRALASDSASFLLSKLLYPLPGPILLGRAQATQPSFDLYLHSCFSSPPIGTLWMDAACCLPASLPYQRIGGGKQLVCVGNYDWSIYTLPDRKGRTSTRYAKAPLYIIEYTNSEEPEGEGTEKVLKGYSPKRVRLVNPNEPYLFLPLKSVQ